MRFVQEFYYDYCIFSFLVAIINFYFFRLFGLLLSIKFRWENSVWLIQYFLRKVVYKHKKFTGVFNLLLNLLPIEIQIEQSWSLGFNQTKLFTMIRDYCRELFANKKHRTRLVIWWLSELMLRDWNQFL